MAASNRAARLTNLVADLKKRYKPAVPESRPLFETLLYATLVENSPFDAADQAMEELQKNYFDWNEVRVSSRAELAERLRALNDPLDAADRLKRTLQSVFESIYAFDLEVLKKQNLGQAVKQIAGYDGVTPFGAAFTTQHGLGGHSIAINEGGLLALEVMEIITPAEAKKGVVPGLERAIPKNKGPEAQAALHAMGVEVAKNPYGTAARKLLVDLDPDCKPRLPKKPSAPAAGEQKPSSAASSKPPAEKTEAKSTPKSDGQAAKPTAKKSTSSADGPAAKKGAAGSAKAAPTKKKKAATAKSSAKKTAKPKTAKKAAAKPKASTGGKKKASRAAAKRKPK
ncbi:hypothetical protein [Botrimarina sp.]|uniref:hypothetical protein n=1 Tax=Botrimarina sp. TaxID=2795802 RepID=UPI0032ED1BFD